MQHTARTRQAALRGRIALPVAGHVDDIGVASLLGSDFLLRPIRDETGVANGVQALQRIGRWLRLAVVPLISLVGVAALATAHRRQTDPAAPAASPTPEPSWN